MMSATVAPAMLKAEAGSTAKDTLKQRRRDEGIRIIGVRHEQAAPFAF